MSGSVAVTTIAIDPYSVLVWIVVGFVAGLVASRVMLGHGLGIVLDVVVGVAGAIVGGFLAAFFGVTITVPGHPIITEAIVAFLGALLLLLVFRLLGMGRRRLALPGRRRSRFL